MLWDKHEKRFSIFNNIPYEISIFFSVASPRPLRADSDAKLFKAIGSEIEVYKGRGLNQVAVCLAYKNVFSLFFVYSFSNTIKVFCSSKPPLSTMFQRWVVVFGTCTNFLNCKIDDFRRVLRPAGESIYFGVSFSTHSHTKWKWNKIFQKLQTHLVQTPFPVYRILSGK